jgi:hypothetical protein
VLWSVASKVARNSQRSPPERRTVRPFRSVNDGLDHIRSRARLARHVQTRSDVCRDISRFENWTGLTVRRAATETDKLRTQATILKTNSGYVCRRLRMILSLDSSHLAPGEVKEGVVHLTMLWEAANRGGLVGRRLCRSAVKSATCRR